MASVQQINNSFLARISDADGQKKTAEWSMMTIRDRLREDAYCANVIPPQPVKRDECQVSEKHDTLVVGPIELEPRSRAMAISFRDQPSTQLIRAQRCFCGLFTISSEIYQKTEEELMAYRMPVTRVIESNIPKDMQEIQDRQWTLYAEAAVQALQVEANGGGTGQPLNAASLAAGTVVEVSIRKGDLSRNLLTAGDAIPRPVQKIDIAQMAKLIINRRLRPKGILMTDSDAVDLITWTIEDVGSQVVSETSIEGWKYNKAAGYTFIKTVKTDILRPGNIYMFTAPEYLGKFFILNDIKFYIDKKANLISMQAWMNLGMLLVNVASIVKTELYPGDASENDADGIVPSVTPVDETQLGLLNNKVDQGYVFPKVAQY